MADPEVSYAGNILTFVPSKENLDPSRRASQEKSRLGTEEKLHQYPRLGCGWYAVSAHEWLTTGNGG